MSPGPKPLPSKVCPACKIDKPRSEYYKKRSTISFLCKPCSLIDSRKRAARYFGKYTEYMNQWRRNKYETDPAHRELLSQRKKAFYLNNRDRLGVKRRERWKSDPYCPARLHYRRKDVKYRTPKWVDKNALRDVYAGCPKGYHVDHIIPLKGLIDGRQVSGLHVPWNLQYLTKEANLKKHNRISSDSL